MKIQNAYSQVDRSTDFKTVGKTKTVQYHKDECDINVIVDRHLTQGGVITEAEYVDEVVVLPDNMDYHEALNFVMDADEAFMQLPADIRTAHDNDAGKLLKHVYSDDYTSGRVDVYGNSKEAPAPVQNAPEPESRPEKDE